MRGSFDREALLGLFGELADHLRRDGVRGHIYVIGGAAMALGYRRGRTTRDVDAHVTNHGPEHASVMEAVREIARKHDLPENWLNETATMFSPRGEDPRAKTVFSSQHLTVTGASAEHMLAMKLQAGREGDLEDIDTLLTHLKITSSEDALKLYEQVFPATPVSEEAESHVRARFGGGRRRS